jgi:hypothetical protein
VQFNFSQYSENFKNTLHGHLSFLQNSFLQKEEDLQW